MLDPAREVSPKLRRRIVLLHSILPVCVAVFFWIAFGLAAVFQIDLATTLRHRPYDSSSPTIYLTLAVLSTAVGPVVALVQIRKAMSLARNGIEITGKVTKIGLLSASGLVHVECAYSHRNRRFTHAWSHPKDGDDSLSVGAPVVLLVDPRNPSRCMRKDEVVPKSDDGMV